MKDDVLKIELVPSTVGTPAERQFCISAIVNDSVAIDAGSLGLLWPLERQQAIQHVFISHTHLDHIASLPLFLDNVFRPVEGCPEIYACPATEQSLRRDVFNDRIWPDFFRLSIEEWPFLNLQPLHSQQPIELSGLSVTPVSVNHVIPTMAFIVNNAAGSVAFVSDTHRTNLVWDVLRNTSDLKAVFVECCFPNSQAKLAEKSGHLCPAILLEEISRLPDSVPIIACHLKPHFFEEIVLELAALQLPNLQIGSPETVYTF